MHLRLLKESTTATKWRVTVDCLLRVPDTHSRCFGLCLMSPHCHFPCFWGGSHERIWSVLWAKAKCMLDLFCVQSTMGKILEKIFTHKKKMTFLFDYTFKAEMQWNFTLVLFGMYSYWMTCQEQWPILFNCIALFICLGQVWFFHLISVCSFLWHKINLVIFKNVFF